MQKNTKVSEDKRGRKLKRTILIFPTRSSKPPSS